jgi:hypothetical protein
MAVATITSITPVQGGITVFGNKRIVIADVVVDTGTWASSGIALTGPNFGLQALDALIITNGTKAHYNWSSDVLNAYISTTAGAPFALPATATTLGETLRVMAIGYGLK